MGLFTKIVDLQKLNQAWERVKKNKPAAGIDHETWEQFEESKRIKLRQLQIELTNHSYEASPVKRVTLYKENKSRTIALYCMKDKVVQQSLAAELNKLYDSSFSDATFAYRNNKSALVALEVIEKAVCDEQYHYALKIDIEHFFDSIRFADLEKILRKNIYEDDVIHLIRQNSVTKVLEDTGELMETECGIHQGSSIAPVLSNIYLMDFDKWLSTQDKFFIRYSDDILVLGKDREELLGLLSLVRKKLSVLGLNINDKKSGCYDLKDGFDFLGYSFHKGGRTVPKKATDNLEKRLEMMWLDNELSFDEKIKKASQIIGGWEQYFKKEKDITSIYEFTALMAVSRASEEHVKYLAEKRPSLSNIYKDIAVYLANVWKSHSMYETELLEYEQFFGLSEIKELAVTSSEVLLRELLMQYRLLMIDEDSEDIITEIMQIYTDLRLYEKASFWMNKREGVNKKASLPIIPSVKQESHLIINGHTVGRIMRYFAGREDIYGIDACKQGTNRQIETVLLPLTEAELTRHLKGEITLTTYLQRPNSTSKFFVYDVDVSKKVLLQYDRSTKEFKRYLKKAFDKALEISDVLHKLGMESYVEYSGCRGYHVWLLFTEWIPVRFLNMLGDLVLNRVTSNEDITIECFPNKTRIKPGKYGQCIKMPLGIHSKTGEQSYFVNCDGDIISDVNALLDNMAAYPASTVKKVLGANTEYKEKGTVTEIELDAEVFTQLPASVNTVLNNCSLMKYLCQKASSTGYLSHFERMSILYVFGHLGDDGHEFIHKIMQMTLNYQYNTTEKFITRIPEKPISCIKLRDQYKNLTAEYGCNCNFKRSKNCYPSPVLHAISLSPEVSEGITIPTSRTLTKEKEKKVIDELNVHKKAEELAVKILENKKQRRKLDSAIKKLESELCKIYDDEHIDSLEIEMGLLVRRKKDDGYEWLIEI